MSLCDEIKKLLGCSEVSNTSDFDQIYTKLNKIEQLINNMATKQEQFDEQLAVITAKQSEQEDLLLDIQEAVSAEADEVKTAIDELKAMVAEGTVDPSALSGVIERLDTHKTNLESFAQSVDDIYEEDADEGGSAEGTTSDPEPVETGDEQTV